MPIQTVSRSFSGRIPSLASVYGDDPHNRTSLSSSERDTMPSRPDCKDRIHNFPSPSPISGGTRGHFASFMFRHDSVSTTTSDSANSSPTTTASLVGSCSNFSETPGTSPDTPASTQSLSYSPLFIPMHGVLDHQPTTPLPELTRPNPPIRKPRNLKNLAVDTSGAFSLGRAVSTTSLSVHGVHDSPSLLTPSSPTFLKPLIPPRRKSSKLGLTILTPGADSQLQQSFAVPHTPILTRPVPLRQFQSVPALSVLSPGTGPEGSMKFMSFPRPFVPVGFSSALFERDEDEQSRNFDTPQSREEKLAGYPDGPICIYDPHVYLYFEPTAQEASQYDVIFNVASEVENPFSSATNTKELASIQIHPPDTPKASKTLREAAENSSTGQPEYIHVPWEHNTDIVPDLDHLVKVIDSRVQCGKRILIHCQCGVSRSASLIVAYGLYKNPNISVQEAYDAVKRRSKWIGPNMNLIMQLQEFRSSLLKSSNESRAENPPQPAIQISHRGRPSAENPQDFRLPRSAPPLPDVYKLATSPVPTDTTKKVSSAPSSAPSDFHWPSNHRTVTIVEQIPIEPPNLVVNPPIGHADPKQEISPDDPKAVVSVPSKLERLKLSEKTRPDSDSPHTVRIPIKSLDGQLAPPPSAGFTAVESKVDSPFDLTSPQMMGIIDQFGSQTAASGGASQNVSNNTVKVSESYPISPSLSQIEDSSRITIANMTTLNTGGDCSIMSAHFIAHHTGPEFVQPTSAVGIGGEVDFEAKTPFISSTVSHYDINTAYKVFVSPPTVSPIIHQPLIPARFSGSSSFTAEPTSSEALLSPQATEFTKNPFHDALFYSPLPASEDTATGSSEGLPPKSWPSVDDPRSPAQEGASPITRNMFDVF